MNKFDHNKGDFESLVGKSQTPPDLFLLADFQYFEKSQTPFDLLDLRNDKRSSKGQSLISFLNEPTGNAVISSDCFAMQTENGEIMPVPKILLQP